MKQTGHGSLKQTVKMMAVSVWKAKASAEALGRQCDWWVAGALSTVYTVGETVGKQAKEGMGPHEVKDGVMTLAFPGNPSPGRLCSEEGLCNHS